MCQILYSSGGFLEALVGSKEPEFPTLPTLRRVLYRPAWVDSVENSIPRNLRRLFAETGFYGQPQGAFALSLKMFLES